MRSKLLSYNIIINDIIFLNFYDFHMNDTVFTGNIIKIFS